VLGERRTDLALRLETDDVAFETADRVDDVVARPKGERPDLTKVDVIANYTAFQQIRAAYGRVQCPPGTQDTRTGEHDRHEQRAAHRLDLPRPAQHLRRPGQCAGPQAPRRAARHPHRDGARALQR